MQTIPDRFTFRFHYSDGTLSDALYTANREGEQFRVTWEGSVGLQYPAKSVSSFVEGGSWQIVEAYPRTVVSMTEYKSKSGTGFKLGDTVVVVSTGETYSSYDAWAKAHGVFGKWKDGEALKNGAKGVVVSIGPHFSKSTGESAVQYIAAVEVSGQVYLIGCKGLEVAEPEVAKPSRPALKPFQRVTTKNGNVYIVVERDGVQGLVRKEGWMPVTFDEKTPNYRIVKVWDMPEHFVNFLDPKARGELLWSDESDKWREELAVTSEQIATLTAKAEELKKQIQGVK